MAVRHLATPLLIVTLVAAFGRSPRAQAPAQAPTTPPAQGSPQMPSSPPDTVYSINNRDRVAPPRPLKEVKPTYTPDAIRNRIQGRVRLQGIVERDGTVSNITVTQSLDSQFGLDQSAIDAFRQWRFQPGMTADGAPVRVLITVELTFALRDAPVTRGWPEGFRDAPAPTDIVEEVADTQELRLRISRPAGWTIRRAGSPSEWVQLQSVGHDEVFAVLRPDGPAFDLRTVSPDAQTAALTGMMQQFVIRAQTAAESLATGQVQTAPDVLWVWSALRLRDVSQVPGVPQNTAIGEARSWVFSRAANSRAIVVQCFVLLPRDADSALLAERLQNASEHFATIIKSISVEPLTK